MAVSLAIGESIVKQHSAEGEVPEQMNGFRLRLIEYAATHTLDELMTQALDDICELVDSAIGFCRFVELDRTGPSLLQGSPRTLTDFCRTEGKGLQDLLQTQGVWEDCARQRAPMIDNDGVSLNPQQGCLQAGHAGVIRQLVVPVIRNDKVVAILCVANKPIDYLEKDVEIVSHLADVIWEIAQRKRAEEALIDSEKRYRRLFESAKDGILILDAHTGMVVDVNPFLLRLLGDSYDDVYGKYLWDIGSFKDISSSKEAFRNLQDNEYIRYEDLPLETTDGRIIDVEFISNVYMVDHTKVIQCNIRDITERKRADAERERLLAAIGQAGEMILITDPGGTIQYVNPAFERVTGYTRQEAIGQNPRMLKSGTQDPAFYRTLWETVSGGSTFKGRLVNRKKDGSFFTEEATISPVQDSSGKIVNYVAVKRDITERLQLTAQLEHAQKMESVGRLAGGVAHDYNNMLTIIIGSIDLALDAVDPSDPLHADLQEVRHAANRSSEMTRQLLAFARKQTIRPTVLDVNGTVEGMLKMLRRLIGEDIDLVWRPRADLWPVKMDPAQIDQILANLCVNARDAIAGVGKITIETHGVYLDAAYCAHHAGFVPGEFVLLAVSDNGCGMDRETIQNIFEPFFTTKGVHQGTGLGLATVLGIVKQNNGFINVYSEPGKGTIFRIYLPRHEGGAEETREETVTAIPSSRGEMVLFVDDEPAITKLGQKLLESLGYRVLAAGTPGEAMRLARKHTGEIGLLITDVVMPGMNGRDLADQLQTVCPDMKTLFMSGYTANVVAHRGVLEEGVHFIEKPFSMMELGVKVRAMLDQT